MIQILKACEREIKSLPLEIREDLADAMTRLEDGQTLSLPLSRPMPSIASNAHELRLKDRSGIYRIIYFLIRSGSIVVVSAFKKTSQQTPKQEIETAKMRIKGILR